MKNKRLWVMVFSSLLLLLFSYVTVFGQDRDTEDNESPLALVTSGVGGLQWQPQIEYGELLLTVTGPDDYYFQHSYAPGEMPLLPYIDEAGQPLADGSYQYELLFLPPLPTGAAAELSLDGVVDDNGRAAQGQELTVEGLVPEEMVAQTGSFVVDDLAFILADHGVLEADGSELDETAGIDAPLDQSFFDDVIMTGSLCVGFDCVNGESFGFDTVRLKENNLRLHFYDTSSTGSFPSNDWRIIINDSSNGGSNYFAIEDSTAGRIPFRLMATAPANSLFVDAQGDVGMGTSAPVTRLHMAEGDTPTVRLDQNGTIYRKQVWDVAGNEVNFFIRDATNGSVLPFRIRPGAPTSSLDIAANGFIGMGDSTPDAALTLSRADGNAGILIRESSPTTANRIMLDLENNGAPFIRLTNNATNDSWIFALDSKGDFIISRTGTGGQELKLTDDGTLIIGGGGKQNLILDASGNLKIAGTLTTNDGSLSGYQGTSFARRDFLTQSAEIAALQQENEELEARLAELEAIVEQLAAEMDQ